MGDGRQFNNMSRKNIIIIGAGQLGSRHLQALALLEEACSIYVVDPSSKGREEAKKRFSQVEGHQRHVVKFISSLSEVSLRNADLVVVSTNSGVRYQVVNDLLTNFEVDYLILEKFLFQRQDEYEKISQKLLEKNTIAYVNCPRRMFPDYQKIKKMLARDVIYRMEVVGNNWGLACNGIHFIDLFQWLCGETVVSWSNELDKGFKQSKRDGYVEFTGSIYGLTNNKHSLSMTSFEKGVPNISVRITTPSDRFVISEALGKVCHEKLTFEQVIMDKFQFQMKYQSQLTHLAARDLFNKGSCELTPYSSSASAHVPFLKILLTHYNMVRNKKSDACPIT